MAKLGEGDARWIVKERQDGTNCNNWHWAERDMKPWSDKRLTELFADLELVRIKGSNDEAVVKTTKMAKCDGEAYINNRKGKSILVYELNVKVDWEGTIYDDKGNKIDSTTGTLEMPYISEENDYDDFQIEMSCTDATDGAVRLKELLKREGFPKIRETIVKFLTELATGGGALEEGIVKRASESKTSSSSAKQVLDTAVPAQSAEDKKRDAAAQGKLKLSCTFRAKPADIYDALLNPPKVSAFTQGPAEIRPEVGAAFKLFGGLISGEISALEKDAKIVQKWRINSWPAGAISTVTITMVENSSGETKLKLDQVGIPEDQVVSTEEGWKMRYFEAIKKCFGYGDAMYF